MTSATARYLKTTLYWLGLVAPGFVPLLAPYLPFQDWPGHVAITAAKHWIDAGALLPEAYAFRGWVGPNRLSYLLADLLVPIVGSLTASNIVLGFGLASLGPAMHFTIRWLGGDPRWALASTALALGRVTACGFGPNVMALPGAVMALGCWWTLRPQPREVVRLGCVLLFVLGMHLFVFLSITALLVLMGVVDIMRRATRTRGLLVLAVAVVALVVMRLVAFVPVQARAASGSVVDAVVAGMRWPTVDSTLSSYWEWNFAYLRTAVWDDRLQVLWAVSIGGGVVWAAWRLTSSQVVRRLVLLFLACLSAFVVLPESIGAPVNWWGGNLRVPTLATLVLIVLGSQARGRIAVVFGSVAGAASLVFVAMSGAAIVAFSRDEMAGFQRLVTRVEPQTRLCTMHYSPAAIHEFPGEPHWYAGSYALAVAPIAVDHGLFGNPGEPVARPREIQAPGMGSAHGFDWRKHQSWCDAFLVRYSAANPGEPFSGQAPECVELLAESPPWRLYTRTSSVGRCARG